MLRLLASPAALLFAGLLLLAAFARWRRQTGIAVAALGLGAFFYVVCTPLPAHLLSRLLAVPSAPDCGQRPAGQLFIVLTGGATGSARDASETWRLERATFQRMVFATALASRVDGARLLISGGAETGLTTEAHIATRLVSQLGWPHSRLEIEDRSLDTYTSAREVAPSIEPGSNPVLVTSATHMRRSLLAYRKFGIEAVPCAVPDPEALIFPDSLIPQAGALAKTNQAWKEVLGLVVYSLRRPAASR